MRSLLQESGLNQHITILLTASRTTDMGLRESGDSCWHRCPTGIGKHTTVRTGLHHPERHTGTGERAAYSYASDTRIHQLPMLCLDS